MESLNLSDKTILLTGGAGAIGQTIVQTLAQHGARIAVNDIIPEDEAWKKLGRLDKERVAYFRADTSEPEETSRLFDRITDTFGMPDVVCCHAGITVAAPIHDYSIEQFDEVMRTNVRASFIVAQAAVQRWTEKQAQGQLIFTSSWVQDVPWPDITPYNTSKAAIKQMARGFAREYAAKGIRANVVAPGIVGVGMAKKQWDTDEGYQARARKAIPLGELQTPESVANAFLFLCSPLSDYMTGSVLLVDGGASLYPMD